MKKEVKNTVINNFHNYSNKQEQSTNVRIFDSEKQKNRLIYLNSIQTNNK